MLKRRRRHARSKDVQGPSKIAGAGVALLAALLLLVSAALALDWLLRADNFPVENVHFEGRFEHVTKDQLVEIVREPVRGNFYALNLGEIKARLESLPWVYRASVRRQWPRDLHIGFSEQQLVARWGERAWINPAGELVQLGEEIAPVTTLPQLQGPAGTHAQVHAHYQHFERTLKALGRRPVAVTLTSRRTWEVQLDNGLALALGREHPQAKLERLVRVYTRTLAPHENGIRQVDLRYTNGFSVEWVDPPARSARANLAREH
jgi:cell division protein FtsQ